MNGQVKPEGLCNERDVILDLYKHHLKLLLEANVFIYAVTGALMSFVIGHLSIPYVRLVLVFPFVFNVAFAWFFWKNTQGIDVNQRELVLIRDALKANVVPKLNALSVGLKVSSIALWVASALIITAAIWLR